VVCYSFKKNELSKYEASSSLLPAIELLELWLSCSNISVSTISLFGRHHINLTSSQVGSLCKWAQELRINFMSKGQVIFQELGNSCKESSLMNVDPRNEEDIMVRNVIFISVYSRLHACTLA